MKKLKPLLLGAVATIAVLAIFKKVAPNQAASLGL